MNYRCHSVLLYCAMNCTLLCSLQPQYTLQQQQHPNTVLGVRLLGGWLFCDHVYPHLAKLVLPVLAKLSNIGLDELIAHIGQKNDVGNELCPYCSKPLVYRWVSCWVRMLL